MAWVVPTHQPHFEYARELRDSVRTHGLALDLHFVTGDRDEADALASELGEDPGAAVMAAADHLPAGRLETYLAVGSIINIKKYVGLHALRDRYALLCTPDSETIALRPGDPARSHALRAEREAYPAHAIATPFMRRILGASARLLGLDAERRIMREVTDGGRLYAWFEDLPGYDRDGLNEMLERLGADRDITVLCDRLSWFDFDHILFQYFNCVYRGWHLDDLGWDAPASEGAWWEIWNPELPEDRALIADVAQRWQPSWVRDEQLLELVPSAFVAFHRDRSAREAQPVAAAA